MEGTTRKDRSSSVGTMDAAEITRRGLTAAETEACALEMLKLRGQMDPRPSEAAAAIFAAKVRAALMGYDLKPARVRR